MKRPEIGADGPPLEETAAAKRLVSWLPATYQHGYRQVEAHQYTEGFLHGKAFIAEHDKPPARTQGTPDTMMRSAPRR